MKYYVYTRKDNTPDERYCIYVEESNIENFAAHEFIPTHMEYSGVMVEADSHHHAHEVYNSFSDGGIIWAEEPGPTKKKAKAIKALAEAVDYLDEITLIQKCKVIHLDLKKVKNDIMELSEALLERHEGTKMTHKQVYDYLKKELAKILDYDNEA